MIGLDTSVIIDFFRGDPAAKKALGNQGNTYAVPRVVYAELMHGLNPQDARHRYEERFYDEFCNAVHILELDAKSCKTSAALQWDAKQQGRTMNPFDCLVAGTLLAHGVTRIITKNAKDFRMMKGLRVIGC